MTSALRERHSSWFVLSLILLVAALLRLPLLGSIPPGLYCDETCAGYDAWSLLQTGRDQYGAWLPLYARSFDVWPEALYRYLIIPWVALLGLDELTVRLPAALVGIATVAAVYGLARTSFADRRVALLAALLLAISPWHVQFSRIGFGAILFPLSIVLALDALLRGMQRVPWLYLSALLFYLSLLTYQPARVFVPLLLLSLALIYHRELLRVWPHTLGLLVVGGVAVMPLVLFWLTPEGLARASGLVRLEPWTIITNYGSYFGPGFLLFQGDPNPRHSVDGTGALQLIEGLLLPLGLVMLLRERRPGMLLLLVWLILYPIPAALTAPASAIRALIGVPAVALIGAYGLARLLNWLRPQRIARLAYLLLTLALVLGSANLALRYYLNYPTQSSADWQYGMRELIAFTEASDAPCVVLSSMLTEPQIFVLFYGQYPPAAYQQQWLPGLRLDQWALGRYYAFYPEPDFALTGRCLFAITPGEQELLLQAPYQSTFVRQINDLRGQPVILLYDVTNRDDRTELDLQLQAYGAPRPQDRPFAYLSSGWYAEERDPQQPDRRWRWMQPEGLMTLVNPTRTPEAVHLALTAYSYREPRTLRLWLGNNLLGSWEVPPEGSTRTFYLILPPGGQHLHLQTSAASDGERLLSIALSGAHLR